MAINVDKKIKWLEVELYVVLCVIYWKKWNVCNDHMNTVLSRKYLKWNRKKEFRKNIKNKKIWKIIKNDVFFKLLHKIDITGHGVHNIIIYNIVS